MKIYVVSHKHYDFPESEIYQPIQVGNAASISPSSLRDNVGENISRKNPYYCELTALYWIWKHSTEDVIGLAHYRRYFKGNETDLIFKGQSIISKTDVENALDKYDIIVSKPRIYFPFTIRGHYCKAHIKNDLVHLDNVIKEFYPNYIESYNAVFSGYNASLYNMFVGKKNILDEYCSWLFDLLSKLEVRINYAEYDDYQKRVFGFLAERLFNVWLHYHKGNIKIKKVSAINIEGENYFSKLIGLLKRQFSN